MMDSRMKKISEKLARNVVQNLAVATLLTGCVFGENQQFFSKVDPASDSVSVEGPGTGGASVESTTGSSPSSTSGGSGSTSSGGSGSTTGVVSTTSGGTSGGTSGETSGGSTGVVLESKTDQFTVPALTAPKIDVLFCVDNSGSMADNQQVLADSFSGFINGFANAGLDYHIGIVTSDVDSNQVSYWAQRMPEYPGANRGFVLSRYSSDRYLTQSSSGLVSKFQDNAHVGTHGSSREQCLNSFLYAMEDSAVRVGGYNHGFFRPDSLLAFVVVSDENEDIQNGETIQARVQRLKDRVAALSSSASRGSRFDFIINKNYPAPTSAPNPGQLQYYPARYLAAAELLSAQTFDIARNFSSDLLTISSGMVQQAIHEFTLSKRPSVASSIVVKINGQEVPADALNGYVYHSDRNTIELMGASASLSVGASVSISYSI